MLEIIKDFIIQNWLWLIPIVLSVVESILIIILKKHPVVQDSSITQTLMHLIETAEEKFGKGHGEDKLNFVLTMYRRFHPNSILHDSVIHDLVEEILSLPSKKRR